MWKRSEFTKITGCLTMSSHLRSLQCTKGNVSRIRVVKKCTNNNIHTDRKPDRDPIDCTGQTKKPLDGSSIVGRSWPWQWWPWHHNKIQCRWWWVWGSMQRYESSKCWASMIWWGYDRGGHSALHAVSPSFAAMMCLGSLDEGAVQDQKSEKRLIR